MWLASQVEGLMWPASQVEFLFNAIILGVILLLRWGRIARGQLFHIYLIAYGTFRFFHEFLRDTPRLFGPISGYQIASLAIVILGITGFALRKNHQRKCSILSANSLVPV